MVLHVETAYQVWEGRLWLRSFHKHSNKPTTHTEGGEGRTSTQGFFAHANKELVWVARQAAGRTLTCRTSTQTPQTTSTLFFYSPFRSCVALKCCVDLEIKPDECHQRSTMEEFSFKYNNESVITIYFSRCTHKAQCPTFRVICYIIICCYCTDVSIAF